MESPDLTTEAVIDIVYDCFPDAAYSLGDGTIRAIAEGYLDVVEIEDGYRLDLNHMIPLLIQAVPLIKAAYKEYREWKERKYMEDEAVVILIIEEMKSTLSANHVHIDNEILEKIVRRTISHKRERI